jgi:hypothetical protein
MSLKISITQFASVCIVIFQIFLLGCSEVSTRHDSVERQDKAGNWVAKIVGEIKSPKITESSGLANSPCQPEVLWTHNDSGGGPFIFAINKKGEHLATLHVLKAQNRDWEDLAIREEAPGECYIYVGDIGNNRKTNQIFTIYKIKEPKISEIAVSNNKSNVSATVVQSIRFKYPYSSKDAEALIVHPQSGDLYLLTKNLAEFSEIYKLRAQDIKKDAINTLQLIGRIELPSIPGGLITGASVSLDGRKVVMCDYLGIYEIKLPEASDYFDDIWLQKPQSVDSLPRAQGEAVAYSVDGNSIFATSEQRNSPLIMITRTEK